MPTAFDNIKYAEFQPTYVGLPIDEFVKTATELNTRYEQAKDAKDQLDVLASNFKVDEPNQVHVLNRINTIRDQFADVSKTGAYEHAMPTVKAAIKGLATDKALSTSLERYGQNRETEKLLFDAKTDKGGRGNNRLLDDEQYADRLAQLKAGIAKGIGEPDEAGFYAENPYQFDNLLGAQYVDLFKLGEEALSGYGGGDTISSTSSSLGYAPAGTYSAEDLKTMGSPSSKTTTQRTKVDGLEAASIVDEHIRNNPNAMAYIKDKVRIHNSKLQPGQKPLTDDDMIAIQRGIAFAKKGRNDVETQTQELAIDLATAYSRDAKAKENKDALPTFSIAYKAPATIIDGDATNLKSGLGSNAGRFATNVVDPIVGTAQTLWGAIQSYTSFFARGMVQGANAEGYPAYLADLKRDPNSNLNQGISNIHGGLERIGTHRTPEAYAKSNYADLKPQDQLNMNNLIMQHGSAEIRQQLDKYKGDLGQVPDVYIKKFLDDPAVKENYDKAVLTSDIYSTVTSRHATDFVARFITGVSVDEFGKNDPTVAALPVYDYSTGITYANMNELEKAAVQGLLKFQDRSIGSMKLVNPGESLMSNSLYNRTGDKRFSDVIAIQIGDRLIGIGIGLQENAYGEPTPTMTYDPESENGKLAQMEYLVKSNLTLNHNAVNARASNLDFDTQIKSNVKPTLIGNSFTHKGPELEVYTTSVKQKDASGEAIFYRYRITNPQTGNTVESNKIPIISDNPGSVGAEISDNSYDALIIELSKLDAQWSHRRVKAAKTPEEKAKVPAYYTFSQLQAN